jgi:acyl CoA:acetate/3-ketoacid CoA transferase beta subunit
MSTGPTAGGGASGGLDPLAPENLMPCAMSRLVRDGDWASHGASVPLAGAALFLALETHAPNVEFWIQGCVSPANRSLRDAIIDPVKLMDRTAAHMSQAEIVNFSLRGNSLFQFLRPLQIDPFGNVNVSRVDRDGKPPLRFQGIAVGDAINAIRRICLYTPEHTPRVFAEQLAFRTGSGWDAGREWRADDGLPPGGPVAVVTPLAVLDFGAEQKRLRTRSLHPGVSLEQVQSQTGFEIEPAPEMKETPPPTDEELTALQRVDPEGIRRLEFAATRPEVLAALER